VTEASGRKIEVQHDPLLERIASLGFVDVADRVGWVRSALSSLEDERRELVSARDTASSEYRRVIISASIEIVDVRLKCLHRLLERVDGEAAILKS
jgi:hypothetical protein